MASHAGVSTATVSRVLSGESKVSKQLSERVWQATRELGYRPNRVARRLRRPGRESWALIVPDVENRFFTSVARGVELVASEHGITVFIGNTDHNPERLERYLDTALAEQVAGVILAPSSPDDDVSDVLSSGIPVVTVDQGLRGIPLGTVMTDHHRGGSMAGSILVERGYTRIGVIAGPQGTPEWNTRLQGLTAAIEGKAEIVGLERADNRSAGGRAAMARLLDAHPELQAVFVTNNSMTIGALREIDSRGLKIPDDIDVVGYDLNSEEWVWSTPVTSINQDPRQIGEVAARMMLQRNLGDATGDAQEVVMLNPHIADPA